MKMRGGMNLYDRCNERLYAGLLMFLKLTLNVFVIVLKVHVVTEIVHYFFPQILPPMQI